MKRDRSESEIRLPPGQPACEPSQSCVVRGCCARYVCHVGKSPAPEDYSIRRDGGTALCDGFFLLSHVLAPEPRKARSVSHG